MAQFQTDEDVTLNLFNVKSIDDIMKYKEERMLESKEKCIQIIESKIKESIDANPLDENIIILYDVQYKKEMNPFIIDYLTTKGFYINKHYKVEYNFARDTSATVDYLTTKGFYINKPYKEEYNFARGATTTVEVGISLSTKRNGYCVIQ